MLLGFLGVIAILRPGSEAFSWFALLPLLAAVFYALSMVLTRSHCRDEPPLTLALVLQISFLITGLVGISGLAAIGLKAETKAAYPFLLEGWAPIGAKEWGVMALLGFLSTVYFISVAKAYQIAPPSIIATFDYGYLVSATLWGFVFFAERPDGLTWLGMMLIMAAGLLVALPGARRRDDGV